MNAELGNEINSEEDIILNFTENNSEKADLSLVSIKAGNNSFINESPKIIDENIYASIINKNPIIKSNVKKNKKNIKRNIITKRSLSKITELSEESKVFHSSMNNNYDDSNSKREFNSTVNSKILKNSGNRDDINESNDNKNFNINKNNQSLIYEDKIKDKDKDKDKGNLDIEQIENSKLHEKFKNIFLNNIKKYELKKNKGELKGSNDDSIADNSGNDFLRKSEEYIKKSSNRSSIENEEKIKVSGIKKPIEEEDIEKNVLKKYEYDNHKGNNEFSREASDNSEDNCKKIEKDLSKQEKGTESNQESKKDNEIKAKRLRNYLIIGSVLVVVLFSLITLILVLVKKKPDVRESARILLRDFNNNTYLALSRMKVACKQDEFLISFTLKQQDRGIYFYEFSCVRHDFNYLLSLDPNIFLDFKTNKTLNGKSMNSSDCAVNSSQNITSDLNLNANNTLKFNNTSNFSSLNDNYTSNTNNSKGNSTESPNIFEEKGSTDYIPIHPNETFGAENKSIDDLMNGVSISDLIEEELFANKTKSGRPPPPITKMKQNKTLNTLDAAFINYSLPFTPKISFCDSSANLTTSCIIKDIQVSNATKNLTARESEMNQNTTDLVSNSTLNNLFLQNVWYQTQSVFVTEQNLTQVFNLQFLEIVCERNFGLAEFFLVFDETTNSFSYKYRCIGSRTKNLGMKCKTKVSNIKDMMDGLDNLVNIKVEAGKVYQFISAFKFYQRDSRKLSNLFEYINCLIDIKGYAK